MGNSKLEPSSTTTPSRRHEATSPLWRLVGALAVSALLMGPAVVSVTQATAASPANTTSVAPALPSKDAATAERPEASAATAGNAADVAEASDDLDGMVGGAGSRGDSDGADSSAASDATEASDSPEAPTDDDSGDATQTKTSEAQSDEPPISLVDLATIEDGTYAIYSSIRQDLVLARTDDAAGAGIQSSDWDGSARQLWSVTHDRDALVLGCAATGQVLGIEAGVAEKGATVCLQDPTGDDTQRWVLAEASDGSYSIASAIDHTMVLDVAGASEAAGATVQIWLSNQTKAQVWRLGSPTDDHQIQLPAGTYSLTPQVGAEVFLDAGGGSPEPGANARTWTWAGANAQVWEVSEPDEDGNQTIVSVASGLALSVEGDAAKRGSNVCMAEPDGSTSQLWLVTNHPDGTWTVRSAANHDLVLDVDGGKASRGANVQIWASNATNAQRWTIDAAEAEELSLLPAGTYALTPQVGSEVYLDPGAGFGKVEPGEYARTWSWSGTSAQVWEVSEPDARGGQTIVSSVCGLALAIEGGTVEHGAKVCMAKPDGSPSQLWLVTACPDGTWTVRSAADRDLVLDVDGARKARGASVQLWSSNDTSAQHWVTTNISDIVAELVEQGRSVLYDGDYYIASVADHEALISTQKPKEAEEEEEVEEEDDENSPSDDSEAEPSTNEDDEEGADQGPDKDYSEVVVYDWLNNDRQVWHVSHDDEGYAILTNASTGNVLDCTALLDGTGTALQQLPFVDSPAQKWIPLAEEDGTVSLQSAASFGMVLDLPGRSTSSGKAIQLYGANHSVAQRWYFRKTVGFLTDTLRYYPRTGKYRYFDANGDPLTGEVKYQGAWYYFDDTGAMARNKLVAITQHGKACYYDDQGQMVYGFQYIDGYRYYFREYTGAMVKRQFIYVPELGMSVYFDRRGHMVTSGTRFIDDAWYSFNWDGSVATNEFVRHSATGITRYYDADGKAVSGERLIDGEWYYFKPGLCDMAVSQFVHLKFPDKTVYYDENGHMVHGDYEIDGVMYHFDEKTGALADR